MKTEPLHSNTHRKRFVAEHRTENTAEITRKGQVMTFCFSLLPLLCETSHEQGEAKSTFMEFNKDKHL